MNPMKVFLALLCCLFVAGQPEAAPVASPPRIAATGHLLMEFHSGKVLAENNADKRLEPASLTNHDRLHGIQGTGSRQHQPR